MYAYVALLVEYDLKFFSVDGEFEMVYRLVELDTLVFTHCMSMLERLLLYKSGRQLFPVQLDGTNGNDPTQQA